MINCSICGTKARLKYSNIYSCENCYCEFLYPQPTNTDLSKEYEKYYLRRNGFKLVNPKKNHFLKLFKKLDLNGKSILEIGGGDGDSALALLDLFKNINITVVESNKEACDYYKNINCNFINLSLEDFIKKEVKKYDVILLFDLIEHLRNPKDILDKLVSKYLANDGICILTFPNVDSFSNKFLGRFWFQYKIEHLFYFSKKSIYELEKICSLKTIVLEPLIKKLPVGYFLSVGCNFGPYLTRNFLKFCTFFVPSFIKKITISISVGEYLWIASKNNFKDN